jgi:Flp pilus assembly protein TadB
MVDRAQTIFNELLTTAEAVSLVSRNHNNELIGVAFCHELDKLTAQQLDTLNQAWQTRLKRAKKEKFSAQFMIIQLCTLMLLAVVCAWLIGSIAGVVASLIGISGLMMILDSKRVVQAKINLKDAESVCLALQKACQSAPN